MRVLEGSEQGLGVGCCPGSTHRVSVWGAVCAVGVCAVCLQRLCLYLGTGTHTLGRPRGAQGGSQ